MNYSLIISSINSKSNLLYLVKAMIFGPDFFSRKLAKKIIVRIFLRNGTVRVSIPADHLECSDCMRSGRLH